MKLIDCDTTHAEQLLAIINPVIERTTALYEYQPRTLGEMRMWIQTKHFDGFPILGALSANGELVGFASYGRFRTFPAFKYTMEHSLYVAESCHKKGVGSTLLEELIRRAEAQQVHVLIGVIDTDNRASIALHEKLGFARVGHFREIGIKFGRWLDVCCVQRILETPARPADG